MLKNTVAYKNQRKKFILIEGVTETGEKFRPSDWAERMCGCLASFTNRRMTYSPQLRPMIDQESRNKCLVLDPKLKKTNPDIFDCIMKFAGENRLKIHPFYSESEETS
ncbi:DUF3579 domain-containing protein [Rickettsiella grylli]|uniref:Uncharacterized protein n=1 Tax=Rickettsiella grylli TaxID=59196 RepID=A8PLQ9_9COXI|nr:DUF3579 domain-containing protein [Rickettsiella grylli]EDP47048.1 conserved hypothetical protein [Rickettsiella grylli]OIZ99610.1 acetyltransferase [Rickettsiella grylli]